MSLLLANQGPPGAITGTLAWQEQTDTCAVAGSSSSSSTISWAETSDTCSISGASTLSGQIAWAESNDGCSISGAASASATLAWTEASDTCAIDGQASSGTTGTLAWTETSDTCAIAGELSAVGTISWTEAADTLSATGAVSSQGALAWNEESDQCEIDCESSGGIPDEPVSGWGWATQKRKIVKRRAKKEERIVEEVKVEINGVADLIYENNLLTNKKIEQLVNKEILRIKEKYKAEINRNKIESREILSVLLQKIEERRQKEDEEFMVFLYEII